LSNRTAIFIDGAYLDKLLELEFRRTRIDFGHLAEQVSGDGEILRTYYYHCPPHMSAVPTEEERARAESKERFFSALARLPRFQTRLGKLVYRGEDRDGRPIFIQKLVDIMLGVDLVQLSATRQINRAVLVAGDSDFVPALEVAKLHGVLTVLWHGPMRSGQNSTVHRELWDCCDDRFEITSELIQRVQRD
jgi:uncharacterized LabA/DUF88 family protein